MTELPKLLQNIHDLLIQNADIAEIFNINDDENSIGSSFQQEVFNDINWSKVFKCFTETVVYLKEYALNDENENKHQENLSSTIYDLEIILKKDDSIDFFNKIKGNYRLLLLKTHVLLLMFAVTATITRDISKLMSNDLFLWYDSSKKSYFRGHADENFKLIPSICRSFDVARYGNELNYSTMYKLYKDAKLLTKYKNVFGCATIGDEFCAFMQHACSYSPFLDLTKNPIVALSFATSNRGNLNDYFKKKSAVYEFRFNEDVEKKSDFSKMKIYFVKHKLKYFSKFKKTYLFYCVPSVFNPAICLLTKQTNDRMKYQDGAFLFFQSCVIVNGHILMPYEVGKIIKYTISPDSKSYLNKVSIYQKIVERHRQYDYEHLMNPYLYFSEILE